MFCIGLRLAVKSAFSFAFSLPQISFHILCCQLGIPILGVMDIW